MFGVLFIAAVTVAQVEPRVPLLSGAFIQINGQYAPQSNAELKTVLDMMRAARLYTVIFQYVEVGHAGVTTNPYPPSRPAGYDPVGVAIAYANDHPGMSVMIGLRLDPQLEGSVFLNTPDQLAAELALELPANVKLAANLAKRYHLRSQRSFGGWYLPSEIANYKETHTGHESWVSQLNKFTIHLSAYCTGLVPKPVAVSPYFDGKNPEDVSPAQLGSIIARFLKGTDVSVVMFQDSVGKRDIAAADVEAYVLPFLFEAAEACLTASRPGRPVHLWLNAESYTQLADGHRIPTDITRFKQQLEVDNLLVSKIVTFDFPDYLGRFPLYQDYIGLLKTESRR
jgi:hypothetical protein